jgi:hypothetical protein
MSSFADRLSQAEEKHRNTSQVREDTFLKDFQVVAKRHAEYRALRDFEAYWLPMISEAYTTKITMVDNRGVKNRCTDQLYGWALQQLLTLELGVLFEVAEIKRFLRTSYVRVTWRE